MNAFEPAVLPSARVSSTPPPAPGDGLDELRRKADAQPGDARAWFELGCLLSRCGRRTEALHALDLCLTLAPYQPDALCERGLTLIGCGSLDDAAETFEDVLAGQPLNGTALFALGSVRYRQHRMEEAAALWRHAAGVLDDPVDALENLAVALQHLQRPDEELAVWNELREFQPDHPSAIHKLAALGVGPVPLRASDAYLRRLFDGFAPEFDSVLGSLNYAGPELLSQLAREVCGPPAATLEVLDAGCGTGLCGERIRPWARRLVGVDLSSGMIERARARGVYDSLEPGELASCLNARAATFDLVLAGDVLIYFGALEEVLSALMGSLRPSGWLLFTVEKTNGVCAAQGYRLEPHGRYSHDAGYVRRMTERTGARIRTMREETLRLEVRQPVTCLLVAAKRGDRA